MQSIHQTSSSPELNDISLRCSIVLAQNPSTALNISILYRDTAGKTLTIVAPYDDQVIEKLPEGGTFFNGII